MIREGDKKFFKGIIADMRVVINARKEASRSQGKNEVIPPLQVVISKKDLREMSGRTQIRDAFMLDAVAYFKSYEDIRATLFEGNSILVQIADPVKLRSWISLKELRKKQK